MKQLPKWQEDFPIAWNGDNYVTRREFTKFLVLISGATFAGSGYLALTSASRQRQAFPSVRVASADELPVGQAKLFNYPTPDDPAILVRLDENRYVAYQQLCTHLRCPVIFSALRRRFECPCHLGAFDAATGQPVAGPPRRPLTAIKLHLQNGEILAIGLEEA